MASTPLNRYVRNGRINIPECVWGFLKDQYTQEELSNFIADHILDGDIDIPIQDISEKDAIHAFEELCKYNPQDILIVDDACTRYDYTRPFSGRIISDGTIGSAASNYFQQRNRYAVDHDHSPGPCTTWRSRKLIIQTLKALWSMKDVEVTSRTLYTSIQLRKYVASQFKPAVAKAIYTRYNATKVYDPSMGWGDRLVAAQATSQVTKYIGTDPSPATFPKYLEQVEFYKPFIHKEFTTELYNLPAEELVLPPNSCDLVFTSPPYFACEKYIDDDKQSFKRYSTRDAWLEGFLYPSLTNAWNALEPGGHLVYNISDINVKGGLQKVCDPMCDFIEQELHCEFIEMIGMRMSKRPNCATVKDKTGTFYEPVWVFKKLSENP